MLFLEADGELMMRNARAQQHDVTSRPTTYLPVDFDGID